MGRSYYENPVKHVVSVRLTDAEMEAVGDIARSLGVNVSTLLRQSLNLIAEEAKGDGKVRLGRLVSRNPFLAEPR